MERHIFYYYDKYDRSLQSTPDNVLATDNN